MEVPFTQEQFLDIFKFYNLSIWPFQIFLIVLALIAIFLAVYRIKYSGIFISATLSFYWAWMGAVYHFVFFSRINPLAYVFSALFLLQGFFFFFFGVARESLHFKFIFNAKGLVAIILFLYALIFYPLLGYALGHFYPSTPTFGLPCPTTIFTFGLLLLLDGKINKVLFIIPVLWALIGFTAALKLGILQDIGLLLSAILTITVILLSESVTKKL
jgi:hypothetical protein